MTLILDSGPLVALGDRRDPRQREVEQLLTREIGSLIVPLPVATEVDYLLGQRGGRVARLGFLEDMAKGRFLVECLTSDELLTVLALDRRYADLDPGLADLSVVVLADRFGTDRIATFDHRDFGTLRQIRGPAFRILPGDVD